MLLLALFCLVAVTLAFMPDGQVPLGPSRHRQDNHQPAALEGDDEWNLDKLPNPNATDHLVFETVHSLLQHWPNTRMRNGHNIIPGTIPKGTLLYHGTGIHELPPGPEWVATDPEHSYVFCRDRFNHFQQGCWHLTLAATRALKVVYFDGSSAAKLPYGSMDTQDLIAWGRSGSNGMDDERKRIRDLCKWGEDFGVDGFVRMEMDFEVMLCDFTSGVTVVSFSNLLSRRSAAPAGSSFVSFEVMNAGSWHNYFPGETRVKLDLAGLISFYDIQLAPSLVDIRASQERWDHRVLNISSEDLLALKSKLESILDRPAGVSSGIDWQTLVQVIVDRYAQRLELTRYLLNSTTTDSNEILGLTGKVQTQLRTMLTPYILFSATPTDSSDEADIGWAISVYKLCATTHTSSMESEVDNMTDSEKLLLRSVRETTREICRVVTKMWAAGVYAGIDPVLNRKDSPDIAEVARVWVSWTEDLDRLMSWLDWNVWVKCDPGCGPEEMCWLPTWPVGFPRMGRGRGPRPPYPGRPGPGLDEPRLEGLPSSDVRSLVMDSLAEELQDIFLPGPDDWIRPQPRCVRRVDPYDIWP